MLSVEPTPESRIVPTAALRVRPHIRRILDFAQEVGVPVHVVDDSCGHQDHRGFWLVPVVDDALRDRGLSRGPTHDWTWASFGNGARRVQHGDPMIPRVGVVWIAASLLRGVHRGAPPHTAASVVLLHEIAHAVMGEHEDDTIDWESIVTLGLFGRRSSVWRAMRQYQPDAGADGPYRTRVAAPVARKLVDLQLLPSRFLLETPR